jgi:putative addiction module component (TIGR02574 family)
MRTAAQEPPMRSPEELLDEAIALPAEERARLADLLLRSLNPHDAAIDREWADEAQRRLDQVRRGDVETVPSAEVFAKARARTKQ